MVLHVLRAIFILVMAAVGWFAVQYPSQPFGEYNWLALAGALVIGVGVVCADILSPRRKLVVFSGTFVGLLVGVALAYAAGFVVQMLFDRFAGLDALAPDYWRQKQIRDQLLFFINLPIGIVCCYITISFILQTKDDFRFVIPYVEFSKQRRGARPFLLDTSVLIDGRISDIAATGVLESNLIVPRFVLDELQQIADSSDRLKRNRGRRGLDVLKKLQDNRRVEVVLYESGPREEHAAELEVDQKLMMLAKELSARVLTNDFNLNKVAQLRGVDVININDLATSLKPVVLPGEKMLVRLVKPGEDAGQGVGYLEDGTMVVVEHGRAHLNEDVEFTVTSAIQTSAGKMIFGRMGADGAHTPERTGPRSPAKKARTEAGA